tara:strand:+ start:73478 stop:73744 length:267 start_codon:yes stop_codon:yes gene_type:complete
MQQINEFVATHFNAYIAKDLEITEKQNVEAFFKIGTNGKISNLKVRDANVAIQAEVIRVLKKLTAMKPATQNGEVVAVMYTTSIIYGG